MTRPTSRDISAALTGVWRLLCLDHRGIRYFDDSVEGFWKSFHAAVPVLPAYAILVSLKLSAPGISEEISAGPLRIVLVEGIGYAMAWVAMPLAAYYLCEATGKVSGYLRYIAIYNWFQIALIAIHLIATGIVGLGAVPERGAGTLEFISFTLRLGYLWFVAYVGLAAGAWIASLMVAVDFGLSVLIVASMAGMLT